MPELPEVQTVVSSLHPRAAGRTILAVRLARTDILTPRTHDLPASILGRRIQQISRRGKRIVFTLDDQNRFYIHLGMTGQLVISPPSAPLLPHTHLILTLDEPGRRKDEGRRMKDEKGGDGKRRRPLLPVHPSSFLLHPYSPSLRFRDPRRFGGLFWLGREISPDHDLGPEPLEMTPAQLAERLARTSRTIKTTLLDQRIVAGLGNIYVDESLFAARIHPQTRSDRLKPERIARLCTAIQTILHQAIAARGSTLRDYVDATGEPGTAQTLHRVYGLEGSPCPDCAKPIRRIVLGGRSTHFCPACQRR